MAAAIPSTSATSSPGKAGPPKSKLTECYERLLALPACNVSVFDEAFWNDFFLLRPNPALLHKLLTSLSVPQTIALKAPLSLLVTRGAEFATDANDIRVANALVTLSTALAALFAKDLPKHGYALTDLVFGFQPDQQIRRREYYRRA